MLDFPVVSGNVSLYNETDGKAIPPTPVVGGVGLIEDVSKVATLKGAQSGDALFVIGPDAGHLGASLYAREWLGLKGDDLGPPPPVNLDEAVHVAAGIRKLVREGAVHAIHDISDGGLACAVAELALSAGLGADIYGPGAGRAGFLFGEDQNRYVVAVAAAGADAMHQRLKSLGLSFVQVGTITTDSINFVLVDSAPQSLSLATLREAHEGWLPRYMKGE